MSGAVGRQGIMIVFWGWLWAIVAFLISDSAALFDRRQH
jgi:hypothetical protein